MANSAEFATWYGLLREADLSGRPEHVPFFSQREAQVLFSGGDPSKHMTAYAGFQGDTMHGTGYVSMPLLDNLDKASVYVAVPPARRRHGIGAAILGDLVALAAAAGRTTIVSECHVPADLVESHGSRRFAERNGFTHANTEIRRELRLPVPDRTLSDWIAEAAPHHADYTVATYVDEVPQELVRSLCYVRNQLGLDAPRGDIEHEEEAMTPEAFLQRQARQREMGITTYWTLATDINGETVAFTALGVPVDPPEGVYQWGTAVLRGHRGHRLGLAVKAANLAALQAGHPERRVVSTQNADTNARMVAINDTMGFRAVEVLLEFKRTVPVQSADAAGADRR
jgi:GNAT superfamily N-acetyltransferase